MTHLVHYVVYVIEDTQYHNNRLQLIDTLWIKKNCKKINDSYKTIQYLK